MKRTNTNLNPKKGIFSTFKEKHPKATKVIVTTGKVAVGATAFLVTAAGGYILFHEPKIGKPSCRSHFNKCGKPKIGYISPERANFQTIKDFVMRKEHSWMPAYVCPSCGKFHVGHKH